MKPLRKTLVLLLLCISPAVFSQTSSKSPLFSNQPEKLNCSSRTLSDAFAITDGHPITISFADNTSFTGRVLSNVVKYSNLQSMTIQLTEYNNAVLQLSKQINSDHTISYVGRIMHNDSSDGYVIEQNGTDYTFKKINTEKILQVCH